MVTGKPTKNEPGCENVITLVEILRYDTVTIADIPSSVITS